MGKQRVGKKMAFFLSLGFLELFLALISFLILTFCASNLKSNGQINMPLVGNMPDFFLHIFRFYDRVTELLEASDGTFLHKGLWFTNGDMLLTADPANVHHVLIQNFENYVKGPKLKAILDILGDGILSVDHEMWRDQRKLAQTLMHHEDFMRFSKRSSHDKLHNGLIPILNDLCERGQVVDMQDLLQRFTFDATSILVFGFDPKSLSEGLPDVPFAKALDEAQETIAWRQALPTWAWKLGQWLDVGPEKKLQEAKETIDHVIAQYLTEKRREIENGCDENRFNILSWYIGLGYNDDKFLRDTILTFIVAGRDSTSVSLTWFFYLLSKNPDVKRKIREEIDSSVPYDGEALVGNTKKLVYLQGALYETLRLQPAVPMEIKTAVRPDILPSGHKLKSETPVLFSIYSMGRMRSIWGEDCLEFKPERWISERGTIKHEPAYKFLAFNAGPRTCLGKRVAFATMQTVAATLVSKYDIEVVKGHPIKLSFSLMLRLSHGLKVKLTKRSS